MLRVADSESLDRDALACAIAGAVCLLLGTLPAVLFPHSVARHLTPADWMATVGPLFFGIAAGRRTPLGRIKGVLVGIAAGVTSLVLGPWPLLGQVLAGGAIGYLVSENAAQRRTASGQTHTRELRTAAIATSALAWPMVLNALSSADTYFQSSHFGPAILGDAVAAGLLALAMGMMAAPLHIAWSEDAIRDVAKRLRPMLDGELRTLMLRILDVREHALKLLTHSRADAEVRRDTRRGLDGVALTALELTERFSAVDQVLSRMPLTGIDERIATLRQAFNDASDIAVRRDLDQALTALGEQRSQIERLHQSKQRLVARLQSELASLEKTEMALAVLISGDAAVAGLRLEALGSSLGRQALELEAEGSALQETLLLNRPPVAR